MTTFCKKNTFFAYHRFMQPVNLHLFTYGYLRSDFRNIKGAPRFRSKTLGYGVYSGILYEVDDYPGVVYTSHGTNQVVGEVLLLSTVSDILLLDEYERARPTYQKHDAEYLRIERPIHTDSGRILLCWVYEYILDTKNLKKIDSGIYGK